MLTRTKSGWLIALLGSGLCTLAPAQGMSEAQMQQMMENAQKMQACMSEIDQSAMEAMARDGKAFEQKISALCAAGEREQAMSEAMAYAKQVNSSPDIAKMRECSKYMQGMMPKIPMPDTNEGGRHICDE